MTGLEDELRVALRSKGQALRVPERPALDRNVVEARDPSGMRWLIAAACFALVVAGVVALTQWGVGDPEPAPPVASIPDTTTPAPTLTSVVPGTTVPAPMVNGWVALESDWADGANIYLVRPGDDARPTEIGGSDTASETCPAWSPDGTRLMFGRVTGSSDTTLGDAELVIVPIGPDGAAGAPTVIALDGFDALEGFAPYPCGTWAPDGRWVALRGPGDVWVVDTQTGAIRRLPELRPIDLEWRPGTDELAIAGDMGMTRAAEWKSTPVSVYSASTGELRQLGSVEAGHITWSPDGSTLAYTGVHEPPQERPGGLWLVDADGTDERLLVADNGEANHGIGPVWSPIGDRIAYQRLCCARAETHEVVLVSVADGTETVIAPPQADGPGESVRWYPFTVSWSPDGATLLYSAWRSGLPPGRGEDGSAHLISVPADGSGNVTVLTLGGVGFYTDHQWVVTQMWGRQPG